MKRTVPALTVFSLMLLLLGGCTTSLGGKSSLQKEVEDLRREVDALKNQNRQSDLKGNLETLNVRLERLEKRAEPAAVPLVQGDVPPAARPEPAAPPLPEPVSRNLYEEGKLFFDRKDYRKAVEFFQGYLREEPKGANAAAAQFYIGESLYSERQYEEAILEYQKVVEGFPKSSQVPTTLLKQGLSFQALGDGGSAKLLYQKVLNNHPKSYAAGVARERLKGL
jgi:tol-pal system protein YbgF